MVFAMDGEMVKFAVVVILVFLFSFALLLADVFIIAIKNEKARGFA